MTRKHLISDVIWLGSSQFLVLAARLVGIRIITELVTTGVYGTLGLMLAISTLGLSVFGNPMIQAAMRALPDARLDARTAALDRLARHMVIVSAAGFGIIIAVGGVLWTARYPDAVAASTFVIVGGLAFADIARTYRLGMLNAGHRQRLFAAWNAADAWLRPLGAVVLVLLVGASADAILLGYALSTLAVYTLFGRFVHIRARAGEAREGPAPAAWVVTTRSDLLRYARPLVPMAVLGWLIGVADRFILAGLAGTADTGLYIAAYGLASAPFLALASILVNAFRPRLFDSHAQHDWARERQLLITWFIVLAVSGGLGIAVFVTLSDAIATIALAESFRESARLMPLLASAYAVNAFQTIFETRLFAQKRTSRLLVIQLAGGASALVSYLLLIPSLGAFGAALGTLVSMVTSCLVSIVMSRQNA